MICSIFLDWMKLLGFGVKRHCCHILLFISCSHPCRHWQDVLLCEDFGWYLVFDDGSYHASGSLRWIILWHYLAWRQLSIRRIPLYSMHAIRPHLVICRELKLNQWLSNILIWLSLQYLLYPLESLWILHRSVWKMSISCFQYVWALVWWSLGCVRLLWIPSTSVSCIWLYTKQFLLLLFEHLF